MDKKTINWAGFSKKTPKERALFLEKLNLSADSVATLEQEKLLPLDIANQMVENVVTRQALPFSVVPDVLVDGKVYQVPFVTEEPSVVAAASFASKIIKRSGGFKTHQDKRQMIGQVALYDVDNKAQATRAILAKREELLNLANSAYPSIVKRGGGACELIVEEKGDFLIVYLSVDTKEAMGANMVNTMMEALVPTLEALSGGKSLMAILSNYATQSLVTSTCQIPLRYLSRKPDEAEQLAHKMALASQLAQVDPYRASTHNKGIFNGIDAVVLATGNDWRAIEAAGHTYASRKGSYQGMSTWSYNSSTKMLEGTLTLPMPIATKGGSIGLNPSTRLAHDLLGQPKATTLAAIITSIGLAQNFAALKALTSTGIQAGHMKLQAKSLALLAGAAESEVAPLVKELIKQPTMNLAVAKQLLEHVRQAD